ncbi:hypothetical protein Hte_001937 [Hypoxylon texense]
MPGDPSVYFKYVSKHLREVALAVLPQASMPDVDSDTGSEVSEDTSKPEDPENNFEPRLQDFLFGPEPSMENIKGGKFSSRIMIHFPNCNRELALRLGRACWATRKRCEALRHENDQEVRGVEQKEKSNSNDSPRVLLSYKGWVGQNIGVALVPQPQREGEKNWFKCPAYGKNIDHCHRAEWSEPCRDKESWTRHLQMIHEFMTKDGQKNVTVYLTRHLEEISLWCLPETGHVGPGRKGKEARAVC